MANGRRRNFSRSTGNRRYRAIFFVAFEGRKTEKAYFDRLNQHVTDVYVKLIRSDKKSAPQYVLNRMRQRLRLEKLADGDQAWLVLDRDHWSDGQLEELDFWAAESTRFGLAVSNPKFEYWVLLHFDDGAGIESDRAFEARLKKHLPAYEKSHDFSMIGLAQISDAVQRAKKRDTLPGTKWPNERWQTRVYRLVESILEESNR